jgi:hypothetical protein
MIAMMMSISLVFIIHFQEKITKTRNGVVCVVSSGDLLG